MSISPTISNTMIDNNGCHPQRLLSAYLCVLCDTSMCQGVLNLFYMEKVDIVLKGTLTEQEQRVAYNLMGYVYLAYTRNHCVDVITADRLINSGLVESYKFVHVMH